MQRYGLRDDQWDRIHNLPPGRDGHVGVTAVDMAPTLWAVAWADWCISAEG